MIVGGLIGAEREYRSKSAGFRTLTLICLGATLFTVFSEWIGVRGAPERIASNVVVGIGFVGAGVISQRGYDGNSGGGRGHHGSDDLGYRRTGHAGIRRRI